MSAPYDKNMGICMSLPLRLTNNEHVLTTAWTASAYRAGGADKTRIVYMGSAPEGVVVDLPITIFNDYAESCLASRAVCDITDGHLLAIRRQFNGRTNFTVPRTSTPLDIARRAEVTEAAPVAGARRIGP